MKKKRFNNHILSVLLILVLVLSSVTPAFADSGISISKDSITIKSGETYQLKVTSNGSPATAMWGSSDSNVASVSSTGLVTGKAAGSAVITAMVNGTTIECLVSVLKKTENTTYRYNVLILDASGSVKGRPDSSQKLAAKRFCQKVLSTDGKNYVAVVAMNSSPKTVCKFSSDYNTLSRHIDSVKPGGYTNFNTALTTADSLLKSVKTTGQYVMKNIVLCSDGLPSVGASSISGKYTSKDHNKFYKYGNTAYTTAKQIKAKGAFIYALGFFHNSKGSELKFGKQLMKDIASKDKYFIIQDADDLEDVFDDIADIILKTTLNKTAVTITAGNTYQLNALTNGKISKASWQTSDSSIARVNSSGKVTGIKAGTATITAKLNDQTLTCKVTVKPKISLNKTKYTMYVGEKLILKASVKGSSSPVTWKSRSSSIASVDKNGVVKALKAGKTTITASVGGVSAKCVITVKKPTHPIHSFYFVFPKVIQRSTNSYINEEGLRIVSNDEAIIEKCGVYVYKSGSYWYVAMAVKGRNITSATISCYTAYNGKFVRDAMSSSIMNKFSLKPDSNNVWSMSGIYKDIKFNVVDNKGHIVTTSSPKKQSENTRIFTSLSELKKWMNS